MLWVLMGFSFVFLCFGMCPVRLFGFGYDTSITFICSSAKATILVSTLHRSLPACLCLRLGDELVNGVSGLTPGGGPAEA